MAQDDHLLEWKEGGRAISELATNEHDFTAALKAFEAGNADDFRAILEKHRLLPHVTRICLWLCTWRCLRVCRLVCVELPVAAPSLDEFREFATLVRPLADSPALVERLVESMDRGDSKAFGAIVKDLKLQRFCFFLCQWICLLRCRRFCLLTSRTAATTGVLDDLRASFEALARLAGEPQAFAETLAALGKDDTRTVQATLDRVGLLRFCEILCRWFCFWHCFRVCLIVCRAFPKIDLTISQLREASLALGKATDEAGELKLLNEALIRQDPEQWAAVMERLRLGPFCYYVCRWLCHLHCDRRCRIVCPPGCLSVFRYIGGYNILTGISSGVAGTGLTIGDTRAFYDAIRLNGVLCKQHAGGPAEFRFEFKPPAGAWQALPAAMIERTVIGQWQAPPLVPGDPIQVKPYTVKGAAPNDMVATITADGWVQVPQESNVNLPAGNFAPNGNLIVLDTKKLQAWTDLDVAGINAGQSTAPAGLGADEIYGLRLVVRRVGAPATAAVSGTCERVAIYNRRYDNVHHGGSWFPTTVDDRLGAALVNIDEIGGGCGKVTNSLTIKYTAAHPNLGIVTVHMDGPGGPYATTLADAAGSSAGNRFGTATLVFTPPKTVATLDKCAYIVKLAVQLLLTTGDDVPDYERDEVAFCK